MNRFEIQVDRNIQGIKLEKKGDVDRALELYEMNISENFEGNHPYDRLAIIYSKKGRIKDEIRVLKKGIYVFEKLKFKQRKDVAPKLDRFKIRLEKAVIKLHLTTVNRQ